MEKSLIRRMDMHRVCCKLILHGNEILTSFGHIENHTMYYDFIRDDGLVEHFDYSEMKNKSENSWRCDVLPVEKDSHRIFTLVELDEGDEYQLNSIGQK